MLKQSVKLVSWIWALGLPFSSQLPLVADRSVVSNTSDNSVAKQTLYSYNSISQATRLELNLRRHQVTVYQGKTKVTSYPVAVGRRGWETPTGTFHVAQMIHNPTWINPFTGDAIPGGTAENPLGHYWIGFWTDGKNWIGFHGTPNTESVGKSTSHGCIRMYGKDVEKLFNQVKLGTPVTVEQ
jgi:lipoprotein-anchoring transpeptidase ErfK/SrfK